MIWEDFTIMEKAPNIDASQLGKPSLSSCVSVPIAHLLTIFDIQAPF